MVPVMITIVGGPTVDRTSTGVHETIALTPASVAEEPRGDPAMVESFTPRVGATTPDSKVETSKDGRGRPPIVWGQGVQIRPSINLPLPSDSVSRPAARLPISQSSASDAISRLQQEKTRIKEESDKRKTDHDELLRRFNQLMTQRGWYVTDNERQQQLIKSLHKELGEDNAELDDEGDDPQLRRIRRECEKRMKEYEERLQQLQVDKQIQAVLLDKVKKDCIDARGEADDAQRGTITMFNK